MCRITATVAWPPVHSHSGGEDFCLAYVYQVQRTEESKQSEVSANYRSDFPVVSSFPSFWFLPPSLSTSIYPCSLLAFHLPFPSLPPSLELPFSFLPLSTSFSSLPPSQSLFLSLTPCLSLNLCLSTPPLTPSLLTIPPPLTPCLPASPHIPMLLLHIAVFSFSSPYNGLCESRCGCW